MVAFHQKLTRQLHCPGEEADLPKAQARAEMLRQVTRTIAEFEAKHVETQMNLRVLTCRLRRNYPIQEWLFVGATQVSGSCERMCLVDKAAWIPGVDVVKVGGPPRRGPFFAKFN